MFKKVALFLGFAFVIIMASPVLAAEFIAPDKESGQGVVVLNEAEVHRNVYAVGAMVTNDSDIEGDLFAAGGRIIVSGSVEQDVNVAGGDITLKGDIGGDVRAGGGNIDISSQVAGDVLIGGGNVILDDSAFVGGDLYIGGGNVVVNSPVEGVLKIGGGEVTINSHIAGNVDVWSDGSLTFGPNAHVVGEITHHGKKMATIKYGARVGDVKFVALTKMSGGSSGNWLVKSFVFFIALAILAFIIVKSFHPKTKVLVSIMENSFWKSLGVGALIAFFGPIIILILFATGVGGYLAVVLLLSYLLLFALSCALAAVFVGSLIMKHVIKREDLIMSWQSALIGSLVFSILCIVPYIGGLVTFILALLAAGGTARLLGTEHRNQEEIAGIISRNS